MEILHMLVLSKDGLVACLVKESLFNSGNMIKISPSEIFPFRNISFFSLFEAESSCIFCMRNEYTDILGDSLA